MAISLLEKDVLTPRVVAAGEGLRMETLTYLVLQKIHASDTGGQYSVMETTCWADFGPPLHVHTREDELFIIHEGEVEFTVGSDKIQAKAGDMVYAPKDVPHTFRTMTPARMTGVATGENFEKFFAKYHEEVSKAETNFQELIRIAEEHGIYFVQA